MEEALHKRSRLATSAAVCLLAVLAGELIFSVRQQSQTWDEGAHIWAGYSYWECGDFGINPEHPPLVKLLAALPLRLQHLQAAGPACGTTPAASEFRYGRSFLYHQDAERILLFARLSCTTLTLLLAVFIFVAARRMFGPGVALLALTVAVFEPNLLAHGALVTTDMGVTCFFFVAVYLFYRYTQRPSAGILLLTGITSGLALAAKHSGVILFPCLALLALANDFLETPHGFASRRSEADPGIPRTRRLMRQLLALLVIAAVAIVILWTCYGYRFAARPAGAKMVYSPDESAQMATDLGIRNPLVIRVIPAVARRRLLPESYLYGLMAIGIDSIVGRRAFLFGKVYPRGRWFYFPASFLIKSTLGFLFLLLGASIYLPRRWKDYPREILFLTLPPVLYFGMSMTSGMNIGYRHVLPVIPFLAVLAAWSACRLARAMKWGTCVVAALMIAHILSSARSFPNYLSYANEAWGGQANLYQLISNSNVDMGQGLKAAREYLRRARITDCWMAYNGTASVDYYQIPCKHLPNALSWDPVDEVPQVIRGTILISATELSGQYWELGYLHPYREFQRVKPAEILGGSILVYRGEFESRIIAAMSHWNRSQIFSEVWNWEQALSESRAAVELAPASAKAHHALAEALAHTGQREAARAAYRSAISMARREGEYFPKTLLRSMEHQLAAL